MAKIPENIIQEIREKTDIAEVVGQYTSLVKRGNGYSCSCPFHEDRNPSFSIHAQKQLFKCFSCGRGGNVFTFLQEIEGISFIEAVKKVAELSGVVIDEQYMTTPQKKDNPHQALIQLHDKAKEFYHFCLVATVSGESALEYLRERLYSDETLEKFQLGVAPDNSALLIQVLEQANFTHEQMLESGIFYEDDRGKLVDRFRGRLIVPLFNEAGDCIAFSGRVYPGSKMANAKGKYVNSPETPIFQKSLLLYNLNKAKPFIRRQQQVLVCEGYMDVITLSQAGFDHVVASMGTSLTQQHLQRLSKLSDEVIFVFDGDDAGQSAIDRAFELSRTLNQSKTTFKSIRIPMKMDPDEWIKSNGKESFQRLVNQSLTLYEFYKEYWQTTYSLQDDALKSKYIEALLALIPSISSPIERQLRVQDLAKEFDLNADLLLEQMMRKQAIQPPNQPTHSDHITTLYSSHDDAANLTLPIKPHEIGTSGTYDMLSVEIRHQDSAIRSQKALHSEQYLLTQLLFYPEAWQFVENLPEHTLMLFNEVSQKAYLYLDNYYYEGNHFPLTGVVNQIDDVQVNRLLTDLIWQYQSFPFVLDSMQDCLNVIESAYTEFEIKELREKLAAYQLAQQYDKTMETASRIMVLTRKLKKS